MRLSLYVILMLFCTSLAFAEKLEKTIVVNTLLKSTTSWDGSQLAAYPEGQPEITILKIIIPAGKKIPRHQHPYINAGVLTKGELTILTEEGQKITMTAGDAIVEIVDKWHSGKSSGNVAAEVIVFYAGIKGQPVTVK